MRLADYVIQFLEEYGVEHIFTVCGGGSVFLNDALGQSKKIKYVAMHHEQAASMAAEGYARIKNSLGVVMVTSGPGGTNSITGCAGAWTDNIPHLTISGQVFLNQTINEHPGLRTLGIQEINIIDIVKPITKYAVQIKDPLKIRYHLEKALYLATHGRNGPVWLDIPANIQNANINPEALDKWLGLLTYPSDEANVHKALSEQVSRVVELLKTSKRPIFHIGQGIRFAEAEEYFKNLVEYHNVPFLTARNGNDLFSFDHVLNIGRPGTFAQRGANFAVQTSDVYIAIGTRLSLAQTGYNAKDYARNAKIVMVDIDQAELDKDTVPIDIKINADAKDFLIELDIQMCEKTATVWSYYEWSDWINQCQEWKLKYPAITDEQREQKSFVNTYHFIDVLSDLLEPDDVIVTDMGFAFQCTHQAFRNKEGQRLITNCGLASMGWGLPAAIGAAFASEKPCPHDSDGAASGSCPSCLAISKAPHNKIRGRVICIAGDGGLQMTIQEMATINHHQLPIKLFVFNNEGYTTLKQTYELGFEGRLMGVNESSGLSFPSFGQIASAYGFKHLILGDHIGLKEITKAVIDERRPILCQLLVDPDQRQMPMAINRRNEDGSFNPTSIEDAWPFLDPEEVKQNLEIANGM